jgi:gluconolactonase
MSEWIRVLRPGGRLIIIDSQADVSASPEPLDNARRSPEYAAIGDRLPFVSGWPCDEKGCLLRIASSISPETRFSISSRLKSGGWRRKGSNGASAGATASGATCRVRPRVIPIGGLAMPQSSKHIEQLAPELERIVFSSEPIQDLADGFGGEQGPAEGPLWWKEGRYLLFSDIHNNRRMKYEPGKGVSLFQEPTNRANGLTRDLQGRLIACEHDSRRVTRQELDGSITVIANSFQGRQLNRPNDVVVKSDGCIYFTDPWSSPTAPEQWDLTLSGVYRVTPDLGTISLLIGDFILPNGLAFSPDESVLYINDTRRGHIRAFDLLPNGTLAKQTDRVFVDLRGTEPGVPDSMKLDVEGNVYCGGAGGLWIMDSHGKKLGRIVHGAPATTNLAFGGDDWKTLYFTSRNHLGAINVKIPGIPVPPRKVSLPFDLWIRVPG